MTQTRLIGVGAFVIGGLLLFSIGLFMIGNRRMLFTDRFEVNAEFVKVTGLQKGAIVRVSGMDAGEVEAIHVPATPSSKFRLQMKVREDLHQLVRSDSIATIQSDGLVGNKFVQIDIGSEQKPPAPNGSTIVSREPFDFADLMSQASTTVATLNETVLMLRGNVEQTLNAITETANQATTIIDQVGDDVKAITRNGQKIASDIQLVTAGVREGKGTIGKLVKDDALYTQAVSITKEAQKTVENMRKIVEEARTTLGNLNTNVVGKNGSMQGMTTDLRQTMGYAREAMADLAENSESLKRNFFFRGLFRGRGFYNLDQVSVEDYRAGDFAGKNRQALRVWLDAAVLFTTDAKGVETLTDEGKARLDSAMATFHRYPKQMPLMIEGYAAAPTESAAFIASGTRGAMVRDYLIQRFGLNPNSTGVMSMGAAAADSPRGNGTWDGIGVTMWVKRELFAAPAKTGTR
jgi:phospholipid/cholesterol/gamma-HCH transport system substrate-binding protein